MSRPVWITRVEAAALADCLYLIGQAWVKIAEGDGGGADEDLAAAKKLVPPGAVDAVLMMIGRGELPAPGSGPDAMDTWLETCRMAGAGDLALIRIFFPSAAELAQEEHDAFLERLDEIRAEAERRAASGKQWRPDVPERPPPWEVDTLKGLDRPGSLSESLRKIGLM